jgi:hypothetical protein
MKNRSIFSLLAVVLAALLLAGTVSAAKVTLSNAKVDGPGAQAAVHLVLDEASDGLAGYAVNITLDPTVVKITNVEFPSWAVLKTATGPGAGNELRLMAVDLGKKVQPGAKNIELATITIEGLKQGSSYLHLSRDKFDDDNDNPIMRILTDGSFTVGNAPVATYVATPVVTAQVQGTPPANPAPAVSIARPTTKKTYAGSGAVVPVIGILLGIIIIGAGGYLRRR